MINIILICGPPASGKTYFINYILLKTLNDNQIKLNNIINISFDDFFEKEYKNQYEKFKSSRKEFVNKIKQELNQALMNNHDDVKEINDCTTNLSLNDINHIGQKNNHDIFIIIEDNFPLRSSRKMIYNEIKKEIQKMGMNLKESFLEIHIFHKNKEDYSIYNMKKTNPIPISIIHSMIEMYEDKCFNHNFQSIKIINQELFKNEEKDSLFKEIIVKLVKNKEEIIKKYEKEINEKNEKGEKEKDFFFDLEKFEVEVKKKIESKMKEMIKKGISVVDYGRICSEYKKEMMKKVKGKLKKKNFDGFEYVNDMEKMNHEEIYLKNLLIVADFELDSIFNSK